MPESMWRAESREDLTIQLPETRRLARSAQPKSGQRPTRGLSDSSSTGRHKSERAKVPSHYPHEPRGVELTPKFSIDGIFVYRIESTRRSLGNRSARPRGISPRILPAEANR